MGTALYGFEVNCLRKRVARFDRLELEHVGSCTPKYPPGKRKNFCAGLIEISDYG
jgi:hypothetical protein